MFKVGDMLIGLRYSTGYHGYENDYIITSESCLVKVEEVRNSNNIYVRVVKPGVRADNPTDCIGEIFGVHPDYFTLFAINKGRE